MLPTLCLLALLLSLPRQGDGTLQHDEDDQGLLEARLFQVTAGGNIRGGKKENTSFYFPNLSSDTDAHLSSSLEALFSSLRRYDFLCFHHWNKI